MNTNCLEGMRCPKCGREGPFAIESYCSAVWYDEGTEDCQDFGFDKDSGAACYGSDCDWYGKVGDLQEAGANVTRWQQLLEADDDPDALQDAMIEVLEGLLARESKQATETEGFLTDDEVSVLTVILEDKRG